MDAALNIEEFGKKAEEYYLEIRDELEATNNGKFAAIDFETKNYWLGDSASDALEKAKKKFPNKLFYLKRIGSSATFSVQSISSLSGQVHFSEIKNLPPLRRRVFDY